MYLIVLNICYYFLNGQHVQYELIVNGPLVYFLASVVIKEA